MKHVLKVFPKQSEWDFRETGVRIVNGTEVLHVKARFACAHQDLDAHRGVFSLNGCNGCKPCGKCHNCMGRVPYFEDESGFVHVLSPNIEKCKKWTRAGARAAYTEIGETGQRGGPAQELLDLEKGCGIKYKPNDLMLDEYLADYIDFPSCLYVDWMHTWCSSGGVAQFHVNQYVLVLLETFKMTLGELDIFALKIKLPSCCPQLSKNFFTDRIVDRTWSHMKGFAADVLAAVHVLGMLTQILILPSGLLPEHAACFQHMQVIFTIYKQADIKHLAKARTACKVHRELFYKLYPSCSKPKLHYTHHINDNWEEFEVLMSCFGAEADHKHPKRIFNFAYNNSCSTATQYGLRELFAGVNDPNTFTRTYLGGYVHAGEMKAPLGAWGIGTICGSSSELVSPRGHVRKHDLLYWKEDGRVCVGIVQCFVEIELADTSHHFAGVVLQHRHDGEGVWVLAELAIVSTELLTCSAIPYFIEDGRVTPLYIHW